MTAAPLPHSFVLADLFDVASMSQDVPDHLLENEPCEGLVPCPECGGERWLAAHGLAWGAACDRADLNFVFQPCSFCHGEGVVWAGSSPYLSPRPGLSAIAVKSRTGPLPSLPLKLAQPAFVTRRCARVALGVAPWSRPHDEPSELLARRACRSNHRVSSPAARAVELRPEAESLSEGDGFTVDPHPGDHKKVCGI